MSEVRDSYHAFRSNRQAVRSLLERVQADGIIAADNDKWVSFVISSPEREMAIITGAGGLVARYEYGADYGMRLRFQTGNEELGTLSIEYDLSIPVARAVAIAPQLLERLHTAGVITREEQQQMEQELAAARSGSDRRLCTDRITELFGFPALRWLSVQDVAIIDLEALQHHYPSAERFPPED